MGALRNLLLHSSDKVVFVPRLLRTHTGACTDKPAHNTTVPTTGDPWTSSLTFLSKKAGNSSWISQAP